MDRPIDFRGIKGYFRVGPFEVSIEQADEPESKPSVKELEDKKARLQKLLDEVDREINDSKGN